LAPHSSSCLQKFKRPAEEEDPFFSLIISVLYSDSPCLSFSFSFSFFSFSFLSSSLFHILLPVWFRLPTLRKQKRKKEEKEEEMTKAKSGLTSI
jgi:hypothetical protein